MSKTREVLRCAKFGCNEPAVKDRQCESGAMIASCARHADWADTVARTGRGD